MMPRAARDEIPTPTSFCLLRWDESYAVPGPLRRDRLSAPQDATAKWQGERMESGQ